MADALAAWSEKQKQSRQSTVGSTLSSFVGGGSSASTSADLEAGVDADGDDGGFFGNIRSSVTRATGHHYNRLSTSVGESFDSVPSSDSMQWFGLLLAVGGISMAISFMFLPMVVVSPQKFALLFALGSGSLIASTVVLRGPVGFLGGIFSGTVTDHTDTYFLTQTIRGSLYDCTHSHDTILFHDSSRFCQET